MAGRARRREGGREGGGERTVAHHVKVLRDDHEVHDGLGIDVLHLVLEGVDRLPQALHNRLPLARDTLAGEELGLGVGLGLDLRARRLCFCLLDRPDLNGFALVLGWVGWKGWVGIGGRVLGGWMGAWDGWIGA